MTGLRPLSLALGLLLSLPAVAQAASLRPAESCYFHGTQAQVGAEGFEPDGRIDLTLGGHAIGTLETDASGAADVRINLSELPKNVGQRSLTLEATDSGGESAQTVVYVSRRRAVFAHPRTSTNARRWRARFRLFGFGSGRAFLHYVNPNGGHVKTVKLGALREPCGRIRTRKRRVLPVANPEYGTWRLQFDTRRKYRRKTANRRVIPVRVYRPG